MTHASLNRALLILLGLLPIAATAAAPAESAATRMQSQATERTQLERRFESVGTLIRRSSAALQIDASGESAARDKHARAEQIYQQASAAMAAGDLAKASQLLTDATASMFDAVRLAAPEKVTGQKSQTDFGNKVESVKALLAAHKRISAEKPEAKSAQENTRQIENLLAEAERQAGANQLPAARATLERAYLMAKASISSMRGGETLVRSLNFATKEEEYHYEIDRNDTHQMLVKVLLEDKQTGGSMNEKVRGFLERAGRLRGQAEAKASAGDHVTAIQLLEDSTAELVKAIRNAGVYIPG